MQGYKVRRYAFKTQNRLVPNDVSIVIDKIMPTVVTELEAIRRAMSQHETEITTKRYVTAAIKACRDAGYTVEQLEAGLSPAPVAS